MCELLDRLQWERKWSLMNLLIPAHQGMIQQQVVLLNDRMDHHPYVKRGEDFNEPNCK